MNVAFKALAVFTILAAISRPAFSQTGLGHIGPTNGEIAGVAVGAAAVVAVTGLVLYATLHKQSITGCTQSVNGINSLVDERDNLTYTLVDGESDLHPGERVRLRGKNKKDKSGNRRFKVLKIQHDYGPCQK